MQDSNPRPLPCKGSRLAADIIAHTILLPQVVYCPLQPLYVILQKPKCPITISAKHSPDLTCFMAMIQRQAPFRRFLTDWTNIAMLFEERFIDAIYFLASIQVKSNPSLLVPPFLLNTAVALLAAIISSQQLALVLSELFKRLFGRTSTTNSGRQVHESNEKGLRWEAL